MYNFNYCFIFKHYLELNYVWEIGIWQKKSRCWFGVVRTTCKPDELVRMTCKPGELVRNPVIHVILVTYLVECHSHLTVQVDGRQHQPPGPQGLRSGSNPTYSCFGSKATFVFSGRTLFRCQKEGFYRNCRGEQEPFRLQQASHKCHENLFLAVSKSEYFAFCFNCWDTMTFMYLCHNTHNEISKICPKSPN